MTLLSAIRPLSQPFKAIPPSVKKGALALGLVVLGVGLGRVMVTPAGTTVAIGVAILIILIITARSPFHGLLLWIVTQPLTELYLNLSLGAGIPDLSPTRICIAFLTILVLARASVGHLKLVRFTKIDIIALFFIFGMALSGPRGRNGWLSLQAIFDHYFVPVLVYFLAKNLVRTKSQLMQVMVALVILSTAVGLYAIYEQLTGNVLFVAGGATSSDYGNGLRILRGLLGHPHEFGRILDIVIPLNFFLILEEKRPARRTLYVITLCLMFVGLYFTYRRTAWIAAIASFFIIQWFYPRFRFLFGVLLVVAVSFLYLSRDDLENSAVSARIEDGNTATLNGRTEGWDYAIELWKQQPITGQGYGQFSAIAKREGQRDTAIESEYLSILVSAGLLGFVPYVLLLGTIPLSFIKTFRSTQDPVNKWLIVVFWGAHLTYLINAYTATVNQFVTTAVLFLLAGALSNLRIQDQKPDQFSPG